MFSFLFHGHESNIFFEATILSLVTFILSQCDSLTF